MGILSIPKDLLRLVLLKCSARSLYAWAFCCRVVAKIMLEERFCKAVKKCNTVIVEELREVFDYEDLYQGGLTRLIEIHLPNGDCTIFSDRENEIRMEQVRLSKRHGELKVWRKYDDEWFLTNIDTYSDDLFNGQSQRWIPHNGVRVLVGRSGWLNGKHHGLHEEWTVNEDDNYVRILCMQWNNGLCDGLYEMWYNNGNRFIRGYYQNDRKIGIWEKWDENGNVRREEY